MYSSTLLTFLALSFSISASVIPLEFRTDIISSRDASPGTIISPYEDNFADNRAIGAVPTPAISDCLAP